MYTALVGYFSLVGGGELKQKCETKNNFVKVPESLITFLIISEKVIFFICGRCSCSGFQILLVITLQMHLFLYILQICFLDFIALLCCIVAALKLGKVYIFTYDGNVSMFY